MSFLSHVWLQYDEEFHMCAAMNTALSWDQIYPPLWLQVMAPARPNVGKHSHIVSLAAQAYTPWASGGQAVQPRQICWKFGTQGVCNRKACHY